MTSSGANGGWLRSFFAAVQFLSRIPVPGGDADRDPAAARADLTRGVVFFPMIGALLGGATAVVLLAASLVFPFPLAVLIALTFDLLLSGAFHEDAVADFCDAFGGGWTRDQVLEILRDSRIGSYGAAGLGMALALRAAGLMACGAMAGAVALIVGGALGRLLILVMMRLVPPIPDREGLAKDIGAVVPWSIVLVAAALAWPVWLFAAVFDPVALAGAAVATLGFAAWLRAYLNRRIGGVTGDCLGFAAYGGGLLATLAFAAGR